MAAITECRFKLQKGLQMPVELFVFEIQWISVGRRLHWRSTRNWDRGV